MKSVSGKELARFVERHGWQLLRVHGSHHVFGKSGNVVRLYSNSSQQISKDWVAETFAKKRGPA